jgi:hypothetical protein
MAYRPIGFSVDVESLCNRRKRAGPAGLRNEAGLNRQAARVVWAAAWSSASNACAHPWTIDIFIPVDETRHMSVGVALENPAPVDVVRLEQYVARFGL